MFMPHSLCIANCSQLTGVDVYLVTKVYFDINDLFDLGYLQQAIVDFPVSNQWSFLVKAGFEDDLSAIIHSLTQSVLLMKGSDVGDNLNAWIDAHKEVLNIWRSKLKEYNQLKVKDFAATSVLIRYLLALTQREPLG